MDLCLLMSLSKAKGHTPIAVSPPQSFMSLLNHRGPLIQEELTSPHPPPLVKLQTDTN